MAAIFIGFPWLKFASDFTALFLKKEITYSIL